MVMLEAKCPNCDEVVELQPPQTQLQASDIGPPRWLSFTCPCCTRRVALPVNAVLVEHLLRYGAEARDDHEEQDGRQVPEGPPIDRDDLLDFHLLLEDDAWFDELLASVR